MTKKPGLSKIEQKRLGLRLGRLETEMSLFVAEIGNAWAADPQRLPGKAMLNILKAQKYLRVGRNMMENLFFKEFPNETLKNYKDTTGIPP
jgi:hypothetical protein